MLPQERRWVTQSVLPLGRSVRYLHFAGDKHAAAGIALFDYFGPTKDAHSSFPLALQIGDLDRLPALQLGALLKTGHDCTLLCKDGRFLVFLALKKSINAHRLSCIVSCETCLLKKPGSRAASSSTSLPATILALRLFRINQASSPNASPLPNLQRVVKGPTASRSGCLKISATPDNIMKNAWPRSP